MSLVKRDLVIIPCAGQGGRLNLPYSKELVAVAPGRLLIDYTLGLLDAHSSHIQVVVVTRPEKLDTMRYLYRYQDRFEMAFVYQKPGGTDAMDAVLSAEPWFGERNLVLLPDQVIFPDPAQGDPVAAAFRALEQALFCFIASPEEDPARIAQDGALRVVQLEGRDWRVVDYADKPGLPADRFNAVWAGFGFRAEDGLDGLKLMQASARRESVERKVLEASPLHECPAVLVAGYQDLGTWPRIQHFWTGATPSQVMASGPTMLC